MPHYPYIIVGGGMSAAAAVQGIRRNDPSGEIAIFTTESFAPYDRPPLTKGLWKDTPEGEIWREVEDPHVQLHTETYIKHIQQDNQLALDPAGTIYSYDRLLLATGGTPQRLPFGGENIIYYRTYADYKRLEQNLREGQHIAVIGGGFIGSELSASLAMQGYEVTLIFRHENIGERLFPPDLSAFLTDYYREKGVEVLSGQSVEGLELRGEQKVLTTSSGREVSADHVVAGIGIRPNVELAQNAGLQVEDGIVVNQFLQSSQPDIYAAGDNTSFYNPLLDRRLRLEHEDAANSMGETAGRNMSGENIAYDYLPFFYSDLFDLGYEAVGITNSQLETFSDWQEPFRKGVIYYLDGGHVRGVVLWNVWDKVEQARQLIAQPEIIHPEELKGKITAG